MIITLNVVMAGLVLVGIVTLLAKSIGAEKEPSTGVVSEPQPAADHAGRTHSRRSARERRPAGVR